jgi:uncharacterized protein YjbJ (UPF0337 family)
MKWDRIEADWKQFVGTAKARWDKLTEDQLRAIAGQREQLAGSIQKAYGITLEASRRQIDQWQRDQRGTQGEDERGERLAGLADRAQPGA